jgi:hypothetical protein
VLGRIIRTALPAGALTLALVTAGCAGSTATGADPVARDRGSAAGMVAAAGRDLHVDFDPLTSPADAVRKADLIVTGTVVDVVEGITVEFADPAMEGVAGTFTTFVVQVDRVLDGAGPRSADRVYVAVGIGGQTSAGELAALNPRARAVFVLDDITAWRPHPTAHVVRPAAIPAGARLYGPYADGMWLQGPRDAQMSSVHAELAGLSPAWGKPRTVEQYADAVAAATRR